MSTSGPTSFPSPPGRRTERRSWRDPRLLVGAALVAAAALGTFWIVAASDDTVGVWVAGRDVPAGAPLTEADLSVAQVQLPQGTPAVVATEPMTVGAVAAHDLTAGELLTPDAVVVPSEAVDLRTVTIPVLRNQMPAALEAGDKVDLYVVERTASGEPAAPPTLVLGAVIVAGVDSDSGAFGGTSLEVGVALSVPNDQVAAVVGAQSRGTLTVVDVPVGQP